jgi:L-seryl-tRNA(Ser) seleniumtransferase
MDALLHEPAAAPLLQRFGREALKEELRRAISGGRTDPAGLIEAAGAALAERFSPSLVRVVNATGVLLHTNLGRAPLPADARAAVDAVAEGYSTLEFDPSEGGRGRRQDHVRFLAQDLFGCEEALAVNNNASAVLLALAALARGREVLVSRGELVAIGGSFQIPEILEASGAKLREVGTTNRTTLEDYRRALGPEVALILSVHPSNYEIRGYVRRPSPVELSALAREARIPWVHDQGTGCVVPLDEFGVAEEATVAQSLAAGADLVSFSCDKLFSGPQAGLLVGRRELVARAGVHPVARAVRPDKLALAALAATLRAWKTGAWREFPIYRAASASLAELEERGGRLLQCLPASGAGAGAERLAAEIEPSLAAFGGGTSPEKLFPSRALSLQSAARSADAIAAILRDASPPIVGRVERGRVLLDLRSILPEEDALVATALTALAAMAAGDSAAEAR